eukprot:XP_001697433.1 predicted protein [Chlamydomonas reinhardtii]
MDVSVGLRPALLSLNDANLASQGVYAAKLFIDKLLGAQQAGSCVKELLSGLDKCTRAAANSRIVLLSYMLATQSSLNPVRALPQAIPSLVAYLQNQRHSTNLDELQTLGCRIGQVLAAALDGASAGGGQDWAVSDTRPQLDARGGGSYAAAYAASKGPVAADASPCHVDPAWALNHVLLPLLRVACRSPERESMAAAGAVLVPLVQSLGRALQPGRPVMAGTGSVSASQASSWLSSPVVAVLERLMGWAFTLMGSAATAPQRSSAVLQMLVSCVQALGEELGADGAKRLALAATAGLDNAEDWLVRREAANLVTALAELGASGRGGGAEWMAGPNRREFLTQSLEALRHDKIPQVRSAVQAALSAVAQLPGAELTISARGSLAAAPATAAPSMAGPGPEQSLRSMGSRQRSSDGSAAAAPWPLLPRRQDRQGDSTGAGDTADVAVASIGGWMPMADGGPIAVASSSGMGGGEGAWAIAVAQPHAGDADYRERHVEEAEGAEEGLEEAEGDNSEPLDSTQQGAAGFGSEGGELALEEEGLVRGPTAAYGAAPSRQLQQPYEEEAEGEEDQQPRMYAGSPQQQGPGSPEGAAEAQHLSDFTGAVATSGTAVAWAIPFSSGSYAAGYGAGGGYARAYGGGQYDSLPDDYAADLPTLLPSKSPRFPLDAGRERAVAPPPRQRLPPGLSYAAMDDAGADPGPGARSARPCSQPRQQALPLVQPPWRCPSRAVKPPRMSFNGGGGGWGGSGPPTSASARQGWTAVGRAGAAAATAEMRAVAGVASSAGDGNRRRNAPAADCCGPVSASSPPRRYQRRDDTRVSLGWPFGYRPPKASSRFVRPSAPAEHFGVQDQLQSVVEQTRFPQRQQLSSCKCLCNKQRGAVNRLEELVLALQRQAAGGGTLPSSSASPHPSQPPTRPGSMSAIPGGADAMPGRPAAAGQLSLTGEDSGPAGAGGSTAGILGPEATGALRELIQQVEATRESISRTTSGLDARALRHSDSRASVGRDGGGIHPGMRHTNSSIGLGSSMSYSLAQINNQWNENDTDGMYEEYDEYGRLVHSGGGRGYASGGGDGDRRCGRGTRRDSGRSGTTGALQDLVNRTGSLLLPGEPPFQWRGGGSGGSGSGLARRRSPQDRDGGTSAHSDAAETAWAEAGYDSTGRPIHVHLHHHNQQQVLRREQHLQQYTQGYAQTAPPGAGPPARLGAGHQSQSYWPLPLQQQLLSARQRESPERYPALAWAPAAPVAGSGRSLGRAPAGIAHLPPYRAAAGVAGLLSLPLAPQLEQPVQARTELGMPRVIDFRPVVPIASARPSVLQQGAVSPPSTSASPLLPGSTAAPLPTGAALGLAGAASVSRLQSLGAQLRGTVSGAAAAGGWQNESAEAAAAQQQQRVQPLAYELRSEPRGGGGPGGFGGGLAGLAGFTPPRSYTQPTSPSVVTIFAPETSHLTINPPAPTTAATQPGGWGSLSAAAAAAAARVAAITDVADTAASTQLQPRGGLDLQRAVPAVTGALGTPAAALNPLNISLEEPLFLELYTSPAEAGGEAPDDVLGGTTDQGGSLRPPEVIGGQAHLPPSPARQATSQAHAAAAATGTSGSAADMVAMASVVDLAAQQDTATSVCAADNCTRIWARVWTLGRGRTSQGRMQRQRLGSIQVAPRLRVGATAAEMQRPRPPKGSVATAAATAGTATAQAMLGVAMPRLLRPENLQALRDSATGLARSSIEAVREVEGLVVRLTLLQQQLAEGRRSSAGNAALVPVNPRTVALEAEALEQEAAPLGSVAESAGGVHDAVEGGEGGDAEEDEVFELPIV